MNNSRKVISLNGDWSFAYTKTTPGETEFPKPWNYEIKLPVPSFWDDCKHIMKYAKFWPRGIVLNPEYRQIEFPMGGLKPPDASLPYLVGTGWYKKTFSVDEDLADKYVVLNVDGAQTEVMAWINGKLIGHHFGCLDKFSKRIDNSFIKQGDNELIIAVSNTDNSRLGCGIRGFKGKSAGIGRGISLEITDKARICDCHIYPDSDLDKLHWDFTLDNAKSNMTLVWRIEDNKYNTVKSGSFKVNSDIVKEVTDTVGIRAWSDKEPNLYKVFVTLRSENTEEDAMDIPFGLRYIESRGEKIYLNNEPVFLRGLTDHAYFPKTCTVTLSLEYYMDAISKLKALGFNWMRFHTAIPPEECMMAADILGMMIQAETQNGFSEDDFTNMLLTCRKHPSVVLYCCGNEVPVDVEFEKNLEKMGKICHEMAPGCIYDPIEAMLRVECVFPEEKEDGYTEFPTPHNKIRLDKMREYSDVFATAVWLFSYEALEENMEKVNNRLSIYKKPCLIHEAGIFDTYLNLDLENRYEGTRIGTDLYRAVREYMTQEDVVEKAPVYYRNSCKIMMEQTKFMIEKARKCPHTGGYDFLGASDCHWHRTGYAVGMLNEFFELKPGMTPEEINYFNGESVILSDLGHKRAFETGENINIAFLSSLYGGEDLENGTLIWRITDSNGYVKNSGIVADISAKNGKICKVCDLSLTVPEILDTGEKIKLSVELVGGKYSVKNEWDLWIFTKVQEVNTSNIRITETLSKEDILFAQNGGKVLLLGSGPFPVMPVFYQTVTGGRVDGNCGTVIYDSAAVRNFPNDGYCSWQFYNMLEGANAVCFNELEIDFNPIIEVVSTYKMIRKQAVLFELKVGNGAIMVYTLKIGEDIASLKLLEDIKRYMNSCEFNPETEVSAKYLIKLLSIDFNENAAFYSDECADIV